MFCALLVLHGCPASIVPCLCTQVWERRRRIPSATYSDPLDHIFTEFDEDSDGHLTAAEIARALQSRHVKASEAQVQEFIDGEQAGSCIFRQGHVSASAGGAPCRDALFVSRAAMNVGVLWRVSPSQPGRRLASQSGARFSQQPRAWSLTPQ